MSNLEKELPEFKDNFIASIVKKADRTTLTDSFENQLVNTIRQTHEHKKEVSSTLKTSMRYFLARILLIGICALIMIMDKSIFNRTINITPILTLFFSTGTSIIIITNYKRLFRSFQFLNIVTILTNQNNAVLHLLLIFSRIQYERIRGVK